MLGVFSCRPAPPDELVYTGQRAEPGPTLDAGVIVREDAGLEETFTKVALLSAIADCALVQYTDFVALAVELEAATAALAASSEDALLLEAAQSAWRAALLAWEEAEPIRVGPAARSATPGGQDLRDQIYSWPLVNRCKIEEQLVAETYAGAQFPNSLASARGLGAIEYLLFYPGQDNACSQFSPINGNGTWAALGEVELRRRKAAYAAAAAAEVRVRATALLEAWQPNGGDFGAQMRAPTTLFMSEQGALNAINEGLFYLEVEVKDLKLGRPLGIIDCFEERCPDALEVRWARLSKESVRANLVGFRRLFQGCGDAGAGIGFDDWLDAVGSSELAGRMLAGLVASLQRLDEFSGSFEETLLVEPERIRDIHATVKSTTDLLKTEFVTVLDLELPMNVEGDND